MCIAQPSKLKKWWREIIPSSVCITEGLEKELRNSALEKFAVKADGVQRWKRDFSLNVLLNRDFLKNLHLYYFEKK